MRALAAAALLALALTAPAPARAEEVKASTAAAKVPEVGDLYGAGKMRDPFRALVGASSRAGAVTAVVYPEEVGIHDLELRGLMRDKAGVIAVLVEPKSGAGYLLKSGKLYDYKNKRVPGITGVVQARQKTVVLMTPDKDVQTLRLGETEEEAQ